MKATIIDAHGVSTPLPAKEFAARLPASGFFWLNVANATAEEIAALASALQFDPTLSTWLPRFGQSARFEASPHYPRISTWAVRPRYCPPKRLPPMTGQADERADRVSVQRTTA